jgi:prepilin-type N-terminal cleavage/methylation domain-containing protein
MDSKFYFKNIKRRKPCLPVGRAFTLIELLVVISILGLLASIVIVNVNSARDKAKIAKSKQFAQSVYNAIGVDAVGYWTFDEGSGTQVKNYSGSGNNGTWQGTGGHWSATDKMFGAAAGSFNGTNDYVNCGSGASLNITSSITIEAWIKPTQEGASRAAQIFSRHSWNNAGYRFGINQYTGRLDFYTFQSGANQNTYASNAFKYGEWNHIVVTRNGTVANIYINSKDVTTVHASHIDPATYGGSATISTSYAAETFNGLMDEVRVYSTALSQAEIQQHYAEGLEKYKTFAENY